MNIFAPLGHSAQTARNTTGYSADSSVQAQPGVDQYTYAILNDPIYKALQANVGAANQADQGAASTGFGQALAGYGQIPDLAGVAAGLGLDPKSPLYQLLMGAGQNPNTVSSANALNASGVSTTAQLQNQNQQNIANFIGQMGAAGTYESGATGVGLKQQEQANTLAQYNASQALIGHLADLANTYNTQYQAGQGQLSQGLQDATTRQIGLGNPVAAQVASAIVPSLGIGGGQ